MNILGLYAITSRDAMENDATSKYPNIQAKLDKFQLQW